MVKVVQVSVLKLYGFVAFSDQNQGIMLEHSKADPGILHCYKLRMDCKGTIAAMQYVRGVIIEYLLIRIMVMKLPECKVCGQQQR